MVKKVPVYKDGDAKQVEHHTRMNAYDLVANANFTWKPSQKVASPAAYSPYRAKGAPTPVEPAQAVIDNAGHNPDRTFTGDVLGNEEEVVDMEDVGFESDEVEEEDVVEEDDPAVEETSAEEAAPDSAEEAPKRRGRKPKAAE